MLFEDRDVAQPGQYTFHLPCLPENASLMMTRRDFLQTTAAAASFAMTSSGGAAPLISADSDWFDRPMRWAQLNLTEDDPAKMDRAFWLDYFKGIHADGGCI